MLVSGKARDLLLEHVEFLSQVSIKASSDLLDLFEEKVTSLETMPLRCAYYDNPYIPKGKYRKLALGKHLLILLQVYEETVLIELVIDARSGATRLKGLD